MNIMLVSQCTGHALKETRRILDQFAERKGDCVWQTSITQQGMLTLRKLLRKNARRNTSVICHWIKHANCTEVLWIVGNANKFNESGTVPTNATKRDILRSNDENTWHTAEVIALLAAIAGLFHDFGKANRLFQKKLEKTSAKKAEPYRHEWVSLRLFEAFVGDKDDQGWLDNLVNVTLEDEKKVLARLKKDSSDNKASNPFKHLPPLALVVGWLIVSHHLLPKHSKEKGKPPVRHMDKWRTKAFDASWNSPQSEYSDWTKKDWKAVWCFDHGTPLRSKTWRKKANNLGVLALKCIKLLNPGDYADWLEDRFSVHLARLALMLADHCYSAGDARSSWQDRAYGAYANTNRETHTLKQKLDEHNIGVAQGALYLAKTLPRLRKNLPAITRHKTFRRPSARKEFRWQNKAYELAYSIRARTENQGFFGVNMASTGCGKTFANARIMYGLADEGLGCRFSVALGLRTLTLQTGDALQERLKLKSDDLAVLIGSHAVQQLHELNKKQSAQADDKPDEDEVFDSGSESAKALFDDAQYVRYDGNLDHGPLSKWLKRSPKLHQLLSAPVLVSTIDYLMPATEGERGGKQIAPMLRLLTADLVLDEPDDFNLQDLPALARLVNWAGMLGARVLLSSATLPPSLVKALFEAYLEGRKTYNKACIDASTSSDAVCCAWFDEALKPQQSDHKDASSFLEAHNTFVQQRVNILQNAPSLRYAKLLPIPINDSSKVVDIIAGMAQSIHETLHDLHQAHHQIHSPSGKKVSIGLVRMANIAPMVALARLLFCKAAQADHRIHFCIYHSQHPLIVRSEIEKTLDAALMRHNDKPEKLWEVPTIAKALKQPEKNQIFIVLATAVAEVGRDHDYDWGIVEPSSMRSLIQLAGRIQRHRQMQPSTPNLAILEKNFKALKGEEVAYWRPGFESKAFKLNSKNLHDILQVEQYEHISAIPRIQAKALLNPSSNLADLEHKHLEAKLFGDKDSCVINASLWWTGHPTWCAELQSQTRFRSSEPEERFVRYIEEKGEQPRWCCWSESGVLVQVNWRFDNEETIQQGDRVQPWMRDDNISSLLERAAESFELDLGKASLKFGAISLSQRENGQEKWRYHPWLGVYRALVGSKK
jgi:CRISPR-associated endonuclease/helicase Cas3